MASSEEPTPNDSLEGLADIIEGVPRLYGSDLRATFDVILIGIESSEDSLPNNILGPADVIEGKHQLSGDSCANSPAISMNEVNNVVVMASSEESLPNDSLGGLADVIEGKRRFYGGSCAHSNMISVSTEPASSSAPKEALPASRKPPPAIVGLHEDSEVSKAPPAVNIEKKKAKRTTKAKVFVPGAAHNQKYDLSIFSLLWHPV